MKQAHSIEEVREHVNQEMLSLVYISQPGCTVCHSLLPQVEDLLTDFSRIRPIHVDAAEVKEIAGEYTVFTVPVVILLSEGKELERMARFVPLGELHEKLVKYNQLIR
ncbi:thioredoxin-like protein YdfQ [Halobacillus andaensis]|uniref:Thioredoxin-like protein YdfQ n=1 Tax=Halobacillus andaensis TaxID=1176239 RepID=A0A917B6A6_HALAA|nr:thioredoxin family protein [Halobacillus andaensis]MBP2005905.1 thioredoxin-like negative regulator of GroEL [Halobacillus andaensis]GGF25200.1 thioredoxin-like protein YdfQ [Halobacillus andaensis]